MRKNKQYYYGCVEVFHVDGKKHHIDDSVETVDSISKPPLQIIQMRKGYRFSLDPIILADFFISSRFKAANIADLGTGSGIISLLLCSKKSDISVKGIEIQKSLYNVAQRNVILNGFEDRIEILNIDLTKIRDCFSAESFEAVITNPPFREVKSGRLNEIEERAIARHELKCSLEDVLTASFFLLKTGGMIFMIYSPRRISYLIGKMRASRFEPKFMRFVHSHKESEAMMVMVASKKLGKPGTKILKPLFVYEKDKEYSDEIKKIYGLA